MNEGFGVLHYMDAVVVCTATSWSHSGVSGIGSVNQDELGLVDKAVSLEVAKVRNVEKHGNRNHRIKAMPD